MHTIKLFSEQDKEAGLKKLHSSLNNITKLWTKMSKLMEDVKDPALFQRAFSPGLQEFIEALCFLAMVESSELPSCDQVIIFFHTSLLKVLFLRNGIVLSRIFRGVGKGEAGEAPVSQDFRG